MSAGHVLFALVMTSYILVADAATRSAISLALHGEPYRRWRERTPDASFRAWVLAIPTPLRSRSARRHPESRTVLAGDRPDGGRCRRNDPFEHDALIADVIARAATYPRERGRGDGASGCSRCAPKTIVLEIGCRERPPRRPGRRARAARRRGRHRPVAADGAPRTIPQSTLRRARRARRAPRLQRRPRPASPERELRRCYGVHVVVLLGRSRGRDLAEIRRVLRPGGVSCSASAARRAGARHRQAAARVERVEAWLHEAGFGAIEGCRERVHRSTAAWMSAAR